MEFPGDATLRPPGRGVKCEWQSTKPPRAEEQRFPPIALKQFIANPRITLVGYNNKYFDDPLLKANFDAMADSAVARAYQQMKGALEPEGLPRS